MDGSISASAQSLERARQQVAQLLGRRSGNCVCPQGALFEQLLSIPVAPQTPPRTTESSLPDIDTKGPSQPTQKADDKPDNTKDEAEKESDSSTTIAIAAVTQAQVAPLAIEGSKNSEDTSNDGLKLMAEEAGDKLANNVASEIGDEPVAVTNRSSENRSSEELNPSKLAHSTESDLSQGQLKAVAESKTNPKAELNRKRSERAEVAQDAKPAVDQGETAEVQATAVVDSDRTAYQKTTAQPVLAQQAPKPELSDDASSRRSNRREKWFEHESKGDVEPTSSVNANENSVQDQTVVASTKADSALAALQDMTGSNGSESSAIASQSATAPVASTLLASPNIVQPTVSDGRSSSSLVSGAGGEADKTNSSSISGQNSSTSTSASKTSKSPEKRQAERTELSQQERVRLIQRVSRSFNRITSEGGQINLRLHPQNLGSLNMQVKIEGKSLSAKLTTETNSARDAILQDLPALRQRLAEQGYEVVKFQVEVAGNGADAAFAQTGGQSQFDQSGQPDRKQTSYDIDYRRLASRDSQSSNLVSTLPAMNSMARSGIGIDVHA